VARFTPYSQKPEDVNDNHNVLVSQLNKAWANPVFTSMQVGNSSDYVSLDSEGVHLSGGATVWDDKEFPLGGQRINAPGGKITESTSNSIVYSTNCPLTDYVWMNIQQSHSKKLYTAVYPHIHWLQQTSNEPNWLLEYRWQYQGAALTNTWTRSTISSHVFPYVAGSTMNQVSNFNIITPTSNEGLSDILQIKLKRDSANASSNFATTDAYGKTAIAYSFDIHYERDSMGSRQAYVK